MTELLLWAVGIAAVAGVAWLAMWTYGKLQVAKSELARAEHMIEVAASMAAAEAAKPKNPAELVDRLRRGGL